VTPYVPLLGWLRPLHGSRRRGVLSAIALVSALAAPAGAAENKPSPSTQRQLSLETKPRLGDLDQMLEQRTIRVLLPYSRTLFFIDKGQEKGITAENMRDFERYLNRKYSRQLRKRPLTVILIPTPRDRLFTGLAEGVGDIAAGNLTVTEERLKRVDFAVAKDRKPLREVIVAGSSAPDVSALEDLAGRTVYVRPSTSYAESLVALNGRLAAEGRQPVRIAALPDAIEDEDKLEMLNAGVIDFGVVDDWKGRMWVQVLPNVKLREDLVVREAGATGWAIRKNSPRLEAEILDFFANYNKKEGVMEYRMAQYYKQVKQMSNNTGDAETRRFNGTIALFRKYGDKYGFDPLMLAALGYQESQLRQEARSRVGAIGVMQLMPATGKDLQVGNIVLIEPNIHGGAKYLDQLVTQYFPDANLSDADRSLFAFAAYNAGPGNIAKVRDEAARRGFDRDKWFDNVEVVAAERIGLETTTYVRNIYKYYVAYRLLGDARALREQAREQAAPETK